MATVHGRCERCKKPAGCTKRFRKGRLCSYCAACWIEVDRLPVKPSRVIKAGPLLLVRK